MDNVTMTFINKVVLDLVSLGATLLVSYGTLAVRKAKAFLDAKLTAQQREVLFLVARDAVLLMEQEWKDLDGSAKFSQAVQHTVQVLNHHGITLKTQDIQAAVQSAYAHAKATGLIPPTIVTIDGSK